MANTCTVCPHEKRKEIDRLIVGGKSLRGIARLLSLSEDALGRHRSCISEQLERAVPSGLTARAVILDLVTDLRDMAAGCRNGVKDDFLRTADRLTRATEVFGKLTGEISSNQVTTLFVNLGVRDESELRSALELQRGSSSAGVDDLLQESLEALRFCLRERPEMRESVLRMIGAEQSGAVVIENGDENGSGNGHRPENGHQP